MPEQGHRPLSITHSYYRVTRKNRRHIPSTTYEPLTTLQSKKSNWGTEFLACLRLMYEPADAAMPRYPRRTVRYRNASSWKRSYAAISGGTRPNAWGMLVMFPGSFMRSYSVVVERIFETGPRCVQHSCCFSLDAAEFAYVKFSEARNNEV